MKAALLLAAVAVACAAWAQAPVQAPARSWQPLARDGVHDPRSPAVKQLQEPREALAVLPPDTAGNQVRWVDALETGRINPRTSIKPETNVRVLEGDIIMSRYGSIKAVRFPHRAHTLWLDCSNCHEKIFVSKIGANKISMMRILQGELCGQCHGAVAFPLSECSRCHSVPKASLPPVAAQGK